MKLLTVSDYLILIDEEKEIKTNMWSHVLPGTHFYSSMMHAINVLQSKEKAYDPSGFIILGYFPLNLNLPDLNSALLPTLISRNDTVQNKQFDLCDLKNHIQLFLEYCGENYHYNAHYGWEKIGNPNDTPNTSTLIDAYLNEFLLPKEFVPDKHLSFDEWFETEIVGDGRGEYYERLNQTFGHDMGSTIDEWKEMYNDFYLPNLPFKINQDGKKELSGTYKFK